MPPKTPDELREQLERQAAENPPEPGKDRTADGLEVDQPSRKGFLANLRKASKPQPPADSA